MSILSDFYASKIQLALFKYSLEETVDTLETGKYKIGNLSITPTSTRVNICTFDVTIAISEFDRVDDITSTRCESASMEIIKQGFHVESYTVEVVEETGNTLITLNLKTFI